MLIEMPSPAYRHGAIGPVTATVHDADRDPIFREGVRLSQDRHVAMTEQSWR
jgi:hypothetical protein